MKPSSAAALRCIAPSVHWPVTICVVCYGANARLAERFLQSLYRCTDPALFELRAGLNAVEPATKEFFRSFQKRHGNINFKVSRKNLFKNGMMRRLLHDDPITARWTIWCDDDTHFLKPDWLQHLALKIEHSTKTSMWGRLHVVWTREEETLAWIRDASWYRQRAFRKSRDLKGKIAVEFRFATGAFWAIKTQILYALDWPDRRLVQGGEDFMLGEALRQNGHAVGDFKYGLAINAAERRNAHAPEHYLIRV